MSKNRWRRNKEKLVTVFFQGGLGNQLFQLAAGLDATEGNPERLILDFTLLKRSGTIRSAEILNLLKTEKFHSIHLQRRIYVLPLKIIRSIGLRIRFARNLISMFGFFVEGKKLDNNLLLNARKYPGSSLLLGYFQTSHSALHMRKEIMSVLRKDELFITTLSRQKYLFIHIRRGDYIEWKNSYGVISEKTLIEIGNKIIKKSTILKTLVASEDSDVASRVRDALNLDNNLIECVPPEATGIELLRIISNAKILVLANSSLSWWGAFFNSNQPDTYYPLPWFKSEQDSELILENWKSYKVAWEQ